jgi:hypothetical protein
MSDTEQKQPTAPTALDPELEMALDSYLAMLRKKIVERLVIGEREYKGRWKTMSRRELEEYLLEERLDEIAYDAMIAWRFRGASSNSGSAT